MKFIEVIQQLTKKYCGKNEYTVIINTKELKIQGKSMPYTTFANCYMKKLTQKDCQKIVFQSSMIQELETDTFSVEGHMNYIAKKEGNSE